MKNNIQIDEGGIQFLSLRAIDQYLEDNIVRPVEINSHKGFIQWGKNNEFPDYLLDLRNNVATLRTLEDGLRDYIAGDGLEIYNPLYTDVINKKGETLEDIMTYLAEDISIYGGFALNILRNRLGITAEIYYIPFSCIRVSEDLERIYYAPSWAKARTKYTEYPRFNPEDKTGYSSIFYYKNTHGNLVYPQPLYSSALLSCETEKLINKYHFNSINNNFNGSYIINFNSGKPNQTQKEEIEDHFYDKYTGPENASRPVLCFNDSKDNETTITKIDGEDYGERYKTLSERTRQEIFTAFRATPNLFGIMTETTGFSEQEFAESFKLFNRTTVRPIQRAVSRSLDKILGVGWGKIKPFTINFGEDE